MSDTPEGKSRSLSGVASGQVTQFPPQFWEVLARISHELRTPLNALMGNSANIRDGIVEGEAARAAAGRNHRIAEQMVVLVDDVINYAKHASGELTLHEKNIPIFYVVHRVAERLTPVAEVKGLKLVQTPCDRGLIVFADETRIIQILTNIIENAIKYTSQGEIVVTSGVTGERVWVAVRDSGRGIAREKQVEIFKIFARVDTHLNNDSQGGSGIGLNLSLDLARSMGGDIHVESEVGIGSTFTLYLPRGFDGK
jgi:signal transduction histidine kinase